MTVSKHNSDQPFAFPAELDADLSLEDTAAQRQRGLPARARTGASGYNPYDATPAPKRADARRKPTDLRKLSEWIRLQRQVEESKKEPP